MISYNPIPILLEIGPFKVYSYGLMLCIAALVFLCLVRKRIGKLAEPDKEYSLLAFIIFFAVIGARIAYFLVNRNEFQSFYSFFRVWNGGISEIGGLIGGIAGVCIFSVLNNIRFKKMLDVIIPYVALSFAIGRIGCFLRGCCFGLPTSMPWGILYGENSLAYESGLNVPIHPTQIYLALGNIVIFLILLKIYSKKKDTAGFTSLSFITLFSLQRFLIDFIRYYPEANYAGKFTIFQIAYAFLFLLSILLLFLLSFRRKKRKL